MINELNAPTVFSPQLNHAFVQVSHMCKSELWFWDLTMWGPGIVCLNQYLNFLFPEHLVLTAAVVSTSRMFRPIFMILAMR